MNNPLILDTNIFKDKNFLYKLTSYHNRKILPVVAYAEICVYFIGQRNKSLSYVNYLLKKIDIEVEWLDQRRAENAALYGIKSGDFSKNARDYLIGAHAYPAPRTMVTYNKEHFWFLENRVYSPDEILEMM